MEDIAEQELGWYFVYVHAMSTDRAKKRQRQKTDRACAMSASCCEQTADPHRGNGSYRRVLWAVLGINLVMFAVEVVAGLAAGSASLQADALDFLGGTANYMISLFVVGMALRYRATAALVKGATMGVFGLWVVGTVIWHAAHSTLPNAFTMGAVGIAALIANAASFALLWAYRSNRGRSYAFRPRTTL